MGHSPGHGQAGPAFYGKRGQGVNLEDRKILRFRYFDTIYTERYDARLMSGRIPAHIDPFRYADLGNGLSGSIPIAALSRLSQICSKADGSLELEMSFSKGGSGLAIMQGNISGNLILVCQRCLEPMRHNVDLESRVYFSRPGRRHNGIDDADIIVVDGELDLHALIEDEVLLSLPMITLHVAEECPATALMTEKDEAKLQKQNPFAALKNIKQ